MPWLVAVLLLLLTAMSCRPIEVPQQNELAACDADLRLNQLQTVGSHNSYKLAIPEAELGLIRMRDRAVAEILDYGHVPLSRQLDLGLRQLELDIYHDPSGGRYADPLLPRLSAGQTGVPAYDAGPMRAPGFKVLHVQDIDARSNCQPFVACLDEIRRWSDGHPDHVPVLVLINTKQARIDLPGSVLPLPFDEDASEALDAEIRSVFPAGRLITPDLVRGDAETLRDGVLAGGWPRLGDVRGHVMFALDEDPSVTRIYRRGRASLEGLPMFVNSHLSEADHAAYFTINDPLADFDRIRQLVQQGFLVRTRADADTVEARTGDTARREAAFSSGAQFVSTDYYLPRPDLSDYQVKLTDGAAVRCNRVPEDAGCAACAD